LKEYSIPFNAHDAINSLSKKLGQKLVGDCLELKLELPKHVGSGTILAFNFSNGLSLLIFNCQFKSDWNLLFKDQSVPPLQFNFSIKGGVKHFYNDESINYFLNPLQGTITADIADGLHGFCFPQNQKVVFASLVLDREQYLKKIDCFMENMPEKLTKVFSDVSGGDVFFYQGNYSIASSECIQSILTNKQSGIVRSTYIEGVALELLSSQIRQFRDDKVPPSKQITLRKYDVEKILEAKRVLIKNIKDPPTIESLSKEIGINQTKLKSGFKKVFDKPIKSWLRDQRLELAKLLLLEQDMSIMNIADAVGYTNHSHFSRRFKEKYGVLPSDYAQSIRVKLSDFKP